MLDSISNDARLSKRGASGGYDMKRDDPKLVEMEAGLEGAGIVSAPGAVRALSERRSLEGRLLRGLLDSLGNPPVDFTLWNGETIAAAAGSAVASMRIADRSTLFKLLVNPELHFGDAYSDGSIEIDGDLVRFLETVYRGLQSPSFFRGLRRLSRWVNRSRPNTLAASRENIHHHYDIGNDFYRLWLDREMVYTCAYFPAADVTLEEAQVAKMDHVCRKLRLRPEETVFEASCGWGALALHMATRCGARVRAFNISREQIAYARDRARALGVEGRVEFIEDDYRNASGQYDAFVSVGMLEHVGRENYGELGRVIDRSLKPEGRGFLHSIGRIRPVEMNSWIEKRIFPGARPPTLGELLTILEPMEFSVLDVENIRLHYSLTLQHWLRRFEQARDRVRDMFDERFVRTWRLYLAGSIAAFNTGDLQLFQVLFARRTSNNLPWTRSYLYER